MKLKTSEQKITRSRSKKDKAQTALADLEKKLVRGQITESFSIRFNPTSPKKLISFKVNF